MSHCTEDGVRSLFGSICRKLLKWRKYLSAPCRNCVCLYCCVGTVLPSIWRMRQRKMYEIRTGYLFIISEHIYVALDGENVAAFREKQLVRRFPLHILSGIFTFSYSSAAPALMCACVRRGLPHPFAHRGVSYCTGRLRKRW